ncbi:MAG: hypothetical protein RLZZ522_437 [Verrucomicrobiota bacterium]
MTDHESEARSQKQRTRTRINVKLPWYRKKSTAVILAVVALAAAALLAKPAYRRAREWRIDQNANNATAALAAGNYTEARQLATAVLRLHDDRLDMLVVLQQAMEKLHDPAAVNIAKMLLSHPKTTAEERIHYFQMICTELPMASVVQTWQTMGVELANSPPYLAPLLTRLVDQGLLNEAARLLPARGETPMAPELRLQGARMLLKSNLKERRERGQLEIAELMEAGGDTALPAFRLLAEVRLPELRAGYFPEFEEWIRTQAGATLDDQLLALSQRRQRYPLQESQIVQEAIARFANTHPVAVARWLIAIDKAQEALTLLPAKDAAQDTERFRTRADALLALQLWPEAREWLTTPPEGFPIIELEARRVICDDTPGDPSKNGKAWTQALHEASGRADCNDLIDLHRRMTAAGLHELACEAMTEAVRKGRGRLPLWGQVRDLLPWLHHRQEGQAMLDICKVMATLEPTNPEVVIASLDLSCIFGQIQPAALLTRLALLKEQRPGCDQAPPFQATAATALLADQQPVAAIKALGQMAADGPNASARVIAVTALAKAMLGDQAASADLLARVDWKTMLPEEKSFFTRLLAKLSAPGTTEPIGNRFDPKILPPSDAPVEVPAPPTALPAIGNQFDPKERPLSEPPSEPPSNPSSEPKPLPPIPESIQNAFEPKPAPPLPPIDPLKPK